jgi:hypothetical protein
MIAYTVKADTEQLKEAISLFEFIGGKTADALRVAINKTLPIVKTSASRAIGEQVNLTAAYIKSKLSTQPATRENVTGRLFAESRGTLLSRFEASAKVSLFAKILTPADPIKVKVNPGAGQIKVLKGDAETYGQPFYFRLKNAGPDPDLSYGIGAWRIATGPKGGRIKTFYGPSVSQVYKTVKDEIAPDAQQTYTRQVIDAMRYILQKQFPPE